MDKLTLFFKKITIVIGVCTLYYLSVHIAWGIEYGINFFNPFSIGGVIYSPGEFIGAEIPFGLGHELWIDIHYALRGTLYVLFLLVVTFLVLLKLSKRMRIMASVLAGFVSYVLFWVFHPVVFYIWPGLSPHVLATYILSMPLMFALLFNYRYGRL